MNIFVLDLCPIKAARLQVNKSLVKMCLETGQLLSTAVRVKGNLPPKRTTGSLLYSIAHKNHPCSIWARANQSNFDWLVRHGLELCFEYSRRYNRAHKTMETIYSASKHWRLFDRVELSPFVLCMPDEFKCENPVTAYRNYYASKSYVPSNWKDQFNG